MLRQFLIFKTLIFKQHSAILVMLKSVTLSQSDIFKVLIFGQHSAILMMMMMMMFTELITGVTKIILHTDQLERHMYKMK
jgi:hypothetical protein